jgi:hypothetical protein
MSAEASSPRVRTARESPDFPGMGMKFGTVGPLVSRISARALTRTQASHIVASLAALEAQMRQETGYGATLITGSAALLAMGLIHPSTIPFGDSGALARMAFIDRLAHSFAILGTWLVLVGLVGLSRKLGLQRVAVIAALVAFALPTVGLMVAATFDGFVLPNLAEESMNADHITRRELMQLIRFCVLVASSLTRVYLLLGAVAISLWSWVIHRDRLSRLIPWSGAAAATAAIATLVDGPTNVGVHEVLALVACQTVWMLLAASLMIRSRESALQ